MCSMVATTMVAVIVTTTCIVARIATGIGCLVSAIARPLQDGVAMARARVTGAVVAACWLARCGSARNRLAILKKPRFAGAFFMR